MSVHAISKNVQTTSLDYRPWRHFSVSPSSLLHHLDLLCAPAGIRITTTCQPRDDYMTVEETLTAYSLVAQLMG